MHRAKFGYMRFHGHCFFPSSKAPGYGTVGCVGVLATKSYLCVPIIGCCSILNGHVCCPPAWVYHVFVLGHPMSSTIARVRVIEYQQLCWVFHRSPGTFCGSNLKLVAKKLSMRPLHSTALSTRRKQQQQTTITQATAKTHQEVTKIPQHGRKKHQVSSKGLWLPSTSIWEHPP